MAYAQANDCPGCCFTWQPAFGDCEGEDPCDHAQYEITAASQTGAEFKSFRYASAPCDIPGCGSVQNVLTAVDNPYCCDQDGDT